MNRLRVLSPGLHSSVQDMGRYGYQEQGVPVAGMLDPIALRLANALVGNPPDEAGLEIYALGPILAVESDSVRLAVCGPARLTVTRDGQSWPVEPDRSHLLRRGDALAVGAPAGAMVAVLAVEGGFDLAPVMGSRSTYCRSAIGPLGGKPLSEGAVLPLRHTAAAARAERALTAAFDYGGGPVRVMPGPQADRFTAEALATFLTAEYVVGKEADRMGLRLKGPKLVHVGEAGIASEGLVNGCIQVPGNGQPILLLADHQTVGGYAKIATVISADLARVGRAGPGTGLRFTAVTQAQAEAARREAEWAVRRAMDGMVAVGGGLDLAALYEANLVSGMVKAEWS